MVEIKNRFTGEIICTGETIASAVDANVKRLGGADLRGANLRGANLYDANLYDANLRGANLQGANLYDANLRGADLQGANLQGANLQGADLRGANLRGADLQGANLQGANLRGANLRGANLQGANLTKINLAYQSHDLLAEILRRSAGDDIAKLKVAGLILINRNKCWRDFLAMAEHEPLADWALDELAKWVQPDDSAPEILRERAERIAGGGE